MKLFKKNKLVLLLATVVAGFIGVMAAAVIMAAPTASAFPGETSGCDGCHTYPSTTLHITTGAASVSVAPREAFIVTASFTGGNTGGTTEINWPSTRDNTLFGPSPRYADFSNSATGSSAATLTAPATAGTYTVRVYAARRNPRETDYKDVTVVVAAPVTYTISASANPSAGGSVTGGGSYTSGAAVTLTATANDGYHFVNWTEGSTVLGTSTTYTFTANANRTIVANFALNTYTISVSANPAAGGTVSGGGTVNSGSPVNLSATASSGYHFVNWTEGSTVLGTSATYTFTANANRTIVANFATDTVATYTIDASAGAGGTITPSGAVTVSSGANQTFSITPNAGYHVADVLVDGSSVGAVTSYAFSGVTTNHTISATFAADARVADTTGPVTSNLKITPKGKKTNLSSITLTALVDDSTTGGSSIAGAEYFIDVVGTDGTGTPMTAVTTAVTSATAQVTATPDLSPLAPGRHIIYVNGQDSAGNWGPLARIAFRLAAVKTASGGRVVTVTEVSLDGDHDEIESEEQEDTIEYEEDSHVEDVTLSSLSWSGYSYER